MCGCYPMGVYAESRTSLSLVAQWSPAALQVGLKVLELQRRLPKARVVYCSATGASEARNLGYMERLGLWGKGNTAFADFSVSSAHMSMLRCSGVMSCGCFAGWLGQGKSAFAGRMVCGGTATHAALPEGLLLVILGAWAQACVPFTVIRLKGHPALPGPCFKASKQAQLLCSLSCGSGACRLTSFVVMQAFLDAVQNRGMGALELVAMDMKARGMYVCRTLSFKGEAAFEQASTRDLTCYHTKRMQHSYSIPSGTLPSLPEWLLLGSPQSPGAGAAS